ncbi:hypothetical protein [Sinorhizobium arboris]|uniref:hypothetical protein n=1 Tax=Sinorhizobium arboris TaxID=76745 RepID=UPI00042205A8|nr:hypothetical protein [Sinorhizobium arboris]
MPGWRLAETMIELDDQLLVGTLMTNIDQDMLIARLDRLKLTATRDQFDYF